MKRWHEDAPRTAREWKKHYQRQVWVNRFRNDEVSRDPYQFDRVQDMQKGRFRKKRAFDCGNPRCGICHSDKYPKRKETRQELLIEFRFREELKGLRSKDHDRGQ